MLDNINSTVAFSGQTFAVGQVEPISGVVSGFVPVSPPNMKAPFSKFSRFHKRLRNQEKGSFENFYEEQEPNLPFMQLEKHHRKRD